MWVDLIATVVKALPDILFRVDALIPENGQGAQKHVLATADLKAAEVEAGLKAETPELVEARTALIKANVAYLNALNSALATQG